MDLVLRVELFSESRADALGEPRVDALEARIADIFIANGRDIRRGGLHFSRALEAGLRSEEHTSELQSLMRISYAVVCMTKKKKTTEHQTLMHNTNAIVSVKIKK